MTPELGGHPVIRHASPREAADRVGHRELWQRRVTHTEGVANSFEYDVRLKIKYEEPRQRCMDEPAGCEAPGGFLSSYRACRFQFGEDVRAGRNEQAHSPGLFHDSLKAT